MNPPVCVGVGVGQEQVEDEQVGGRGQGPPTVAAPEDEARHDARLSMTRHTHTRIHTHTVSLRRKQRPRRMLPRMSGVPPSSLSSLLDRYLWSSDVTKKTVPPPGRSGTCGVCVAGGG
jgi:hypothetical protein